MTWRFKKMCEIYKIFAEPWDCDFSSEAMEEMFLFESKGIGDISIQGFNTTGKKPNGYAIGKKWVNVQVAYWLKDLTEPGWYNVLHELYHDPIFPHWWLDKIFADFVNFKRDYYNKIGIKFDDSYKNNEKILTGA